MTSFSVTFSNVLLALLYMLPGFVLCKLKKVRPAHLSTTSVLLLYVCSPCMFIDALIRPDLSPDLPGKMGLFILISLTAEIAMMLILRFLCRRKKQDFGMRMFSVASVMGNVGFFGLPVVRALFPEAAEAGVYSCMFNISLNIVAWTVCVFHLTGERKHMSLKAALLNPSLVSAAVGFLLYLLNAKAWLPEMLQSGMRTVGNMSTPLCMLILGIRLATLNFRKLFTTPIVWLISAGKLLVFPLFCWLLVLALPLDPVFKGCMLMLAATPCASIVLNLAEMHNSGQDLAANCALLSTLLSIVTIPLLSLLIYV